MPKFKDLTGKKFGRLTVIEYGHNEGGRSHWVAVCKCGNKTIVKRQSLIAGDTKSCGCWHLERAGKFNWRHGKSYHPLYRTYDHLVSRCTRPNHHNFSSYGGRGIKNEWNSFEDFYGDMHHSYAKHLKKYGHANTTLDRIDVNGNYSKDNCRWATRKQQSRNLRTNIYTTYKGERKCLAEWAEQLDIKYDTLFNRVYRAKWPIEKAFETPVKAQLWRK